MTGTLTELIPIVPEVHATLHRLCRTNVSAWMSHWTELSPSERSPPGQSPDPETQTWSSISANGSTSYVVAREGMSTLTCAPFPLVSKCVLFPQLFGADAGNAPAPVCFLPTYSPSFPSAVLGKISSNLTSVHAGGLPQRMWDDGADGHPL